MTPDSAAVRCCTKARNSVTRRARFRPTTRAQALLRLLACQTQIERRFGAGCGCTSTSRSHVSTTAQLSAIATCEDEPACRANPWSPRNVTPDRRTERDGLVSVRTTRRPARLARAPDADESACSNRVASDTRSGILAAVPPASEGGKAAPGSRNVRARCRSAAAAGPNLASICVVPASKRSQSLSAAWSVETVRAS